jgi:outer membrane lipoprotein SlyB
MPVSLRRSALRREIMMNPTGTAQPVRAGRQNHILYPLMIAAAVAVTLFSAVGIATMTGWIPSARSGVDEAVREQPVAAPAPAERATTRPTTRPGKTRTAGAPCADCGTVESVAAVQEKGQGSGVGAVLGGVVGGILGNQVGGGRGRTAMTVAGAGAGAYAGHEVEKNMNKTVHYEIRVRMNDGAVRTFYEASPPALGVGQKVRATDRGLIVIG